MFDPSKRSATDFSAVKTGAMTTSQWFALATRGFNATGVATASPTVLYIFQFPAMTGFLIRGGLWSLYLGAVLGCFVVTFQRTVITTSKSKARSQSTICQLGLYLPANLRPPKIPTWHRRRSR